MEMTGALLMSAFVSAVICIPMLIVGSQHTDTSLQAIAPAYAWMTLTSIAGAWGILGVSKLWEGINGEQALRRFAMLVVGLLVGGASLNVGSFADILAAG